MSDALSKEQVERYRKTAEFAKGLSRSCDTIIELCDSHEALRAEVASLRPMCHVCGKPASCIGSYEGATSYQPACDACCGHGNEDGECWPVTELLQKFNQWAVRDTARPGGGS